MRSFLKKLIATFPDVADRCTDDENTLSYEVTTSSPDEAISWLKALARHTARCDIKLTCTVAEGLSGWLRLGSRKKMVVVQPFERDDDLFQEPEDADVREAVDELFGKLAQLNASITLEELRNYLTTFAAGGLTLSLEFTVSINKDVWRQKLLGPDRKGNVVLFVFPCKFMECLKRKSFDNMERDWFAVREQRTVLLLLQAQGRLEGDYLACFGLDTLEQVDDYLARSPDFERLTKIRGLRDQQCNWDGKPAVLTPDHFILQSRGFGGDCAEEIEAELSVVAVQLAVGYLAHRTDTKADPPKSRFDEYKICQVPVGRQALRNLIRGEEGIDTSPLLALYRWAYENYSGDQLRVVRQLVSLELEKGPEGNERQLLTSAAEMLETARFNLQQLMRRNISEYFLARNQVCEFLRKYTDEIAATLSNLTSELISNLYKTLAAIIAAIVAAKLTEKPDIVVLTTAGLYFAYVMFVIVYFLPSVWKKFRLKKEEYHNNVKQFIQKDVLLEEEIQRFQGQSFAKSESLFYWYFTATLLIYGLLASLALLVAVIYSLRLLVA